MNNDDCRVVLIIITIRIRSTTRMVPNKCPQRQNTIMILKPECFLDVDVPWTAELKNRVRNRNKEM